MSEFYAADAALARTWAAAMGIEAGAAPWWREANR